MSTNLVVREDLFQEYLNTIPCKVSEISTSRMIQPDLTGFDVKYIHLEQHRSNWPASTFGDPLGRLW